MIKSSGQIIILVTAALTLLPLPVFATQALVRAYGATEFSVGQAYLSRHGEQCIALLPLHVATEAKIPALLREGSNGLIGEVERTVDLGDDLALGTVSGAINKDCGFSMSTIPRSVKHLLQGQGIGSLRSVNSDGTIAHLAVTVVDNDGSTYLRIQPTNTNSQIRKGNSGALLMVNNKPVGLLLSVGARRGIGKVIRFDALLARAEKYLASGNIATQGNIESEYLPAPDTNNLALALNGAQVSAWSQMAVDVDHRPQNLIDNDPYSFWQVKPQKWPVSVDLDLAGDKSAVRKVVLLADKNADPAELPMRLEILVNASSQKPRWRSLMQGEVIFDAHGQATFAFAPTWVRQIRLVFYRTQSGKGLLSLNAIEVHK